MNIDHENELLRWDLFKSYGEFNLLFETTIHEFRNLLTSLIRISYNYYEEEDEEENELPDLEQNRLIKILMQNMGAMEIVENVKACFIDFFSQQKKKNGNYSFNGDGEIFTLTDDDYKLSVEVFKKCLEMVKLRNIIIHSHYSQVLFYFGDGSKLDGSKDFKTSKGYEERNYKFHVGYFDEVNGHITRFFIFLKNINFSLYISSEGRDYQKDFSELKNMNFEPPVSPLKG